MLVSTLVSVIMPAHDGEKYIAESIYSMLDQTYKNWELIVVDDGSTDRTSEIVRGFQLADNRIKYLSQRNGGQGKARNAGIRQAQGELIAFLDQDDLWVENKLELQLNAMSKTGADVIFSDGYIFADDDLTNETMIFSTISGQFDGDTFFNLLLTQNRIPILSALVRKSEIEKVGLLEEDIFYQNCDDYDLWLKLADKGATFFGMTAKLVRYRVHSGQASKDSVQMLRAEIAVIEKHLDSSNREGALERGRLRSLHRDLAAALVAAGRTAEARKCLLQLLYKEKRGLITLLQILALSVSPNSFKKISDGLYRIDASFSYRIGRPIVEAQVNLQSFITKRRAG